jgi:hypothetical protein
MSTRTIRGAAALQAGVIAVGTVLTAAPAFAGKKEDAFYNAGYNNCDAKLFALSWGSTDIADMIQEAGEKIINGYQNQVEDYLADGRKRNNNNLLLCPASEFYSKEEIAAFAEYWDYGRKEAATEIAKKLIAGEKSSVDEAIREQKAAG